ncbi:MAG: hypothetical protein M5U01_07150 [Ardenticatenaceae bacterium]|nr:hypothetical protein [Ardenticatenaceae bacterium]HBY99626.1 hypothetical protein [Chloroflexota bacterium]
MTQILYPDWREKVAFSSEGPNPQALMETDKLKVVLVGMEAGQKIPVHPMPPAVYHFLDGSGWMTVNEERFAVGPGATVVTPAGATRGIEAETRLAFLGATFLEGHLE